MLINQSTITFFDNTQQSSAAGASLFAVERRPSGSESAVTLTGSAWTGRALTQVANTISGASVVSGGTTSAYIQLPIGVYKVDAHAVTSRAAWIDNVIRLRNLIGVTLVKGLAARTIDGDVGFGFTTSSLTGVFSVTSSASVALQHWTSSTIGGGNPASTGEDEIYAAISIMKIG